jgi:hypothetical protein
MEPGTPTSFIPKRPVTSEPVSVNRSSSRTIGLFSLITFVVVVGTALSYAGVYLWEKQLVDQKKSLGDSIGQAQNEIGSDFLADMKRLNDRIGGVKSLIKTHVVITPIFEALQNSTLRSVQYKTFGYTLVSDTLTKDQTVVVSLTGTAKNYSTIALQSDAFIKESLIKNPVFSGLSINDKTGRVDFKLVFDVDIKDLSFETFIKKLQKDSVAPENVVETQT